jgi:hypothetical protein
MAQRGPVVGRRRREQSERVCGRRWPLWPKRNLPMQSAMLSGAVWRSGSSPMPAPRQRERRPRLRIALPPPTRLRFSRSFPREEHPVGYLGRDASVLAPFLWLPSPVGGARRRHIIPGRRRRDRLRCRGRSKDEERARDRPAPNYGESDRTDLRSATAEVIRRDTVDWAIETFDTRPTLRLRVARSRRRRRCRWSAIRIKCVCQCYG